MAVWVALVSFVIALVMMAYRPAFTDVTVTLILYFGAPGALCLAGLTLWAYRKESAEDSGLALRRVQSKVAIGLALAAATIVYTLIIFSKKLDPAATAAGS